MADDEEEDIRDRVPLHTELGEKWEDAEFGYHSTGPDHWMGAGSYGPPEGKLPSEQGWWITPDVPPTAEDYKQWAADAQEMREKGLSFTQHRMNTLVCKRCHMQLTIRDQSRYRGRNRDKGEVLCSECR